MLHAVAGLPMKGEEMATTARRTLRMTFVGKHNVLKIVGFQSSMIGPESIGYANAPIAGANKKNENAGKDTSPMLSRYLEGKDDPFAVSVTPEKTEGSNNARQ